MQILQINNVWSSETLCSNLVFLSLQVILKGLEKYTSLLQHLYIMNLWYFIVQAPGSGSVFQDLA